MWGVGTCLAVSPTDGFNGHRGLGREPDRHAGGWGRSSVTVATQGQLQLQEGVPPEQGQSLKHLADAQSRGPGGMMAKPGPMPYSVLFTDGLKLRGSPLAPGGAPREGAEGAWDLQA